jgi:type IV pilus assembly protein PilX
MTRAPVRAQRGPRAQRGFMIAVVMVVLVAMMLSAVALLRSTDTNQLVSGNLAFRSATVHSADTGVQAAVIWLQNTVGGATLNTNAPASGYYAVLATPDLNFDDATLWSQCVACSSNDAAGNTVSWIVQRLCTGQGNPNDPSIQCSRLEAGSAGASGNSMAADATAFPGVARNYYRITVRVNGPRNTSTLTQTFVTL